MAQRQSTRARLTALLNAAQSLLADEPADNLSLEDVARRLETSPRQLERAFSEAGSTTFRAEVTVARLKRAAQLLANPRLTVREVATAVGCRQPPHFAKAFREAYGLSPAAWRLELHRVSRPISERVRRQGIEDREALRQAIHDLGAKR